jgi:ABC-type uncharacterized transport system permease subunit
LHHPAALGKDPLRAYADILRNTLGTKWVRRVGQDDSAGAVRCAVLLPARIRLVNVGSEGQLYMGAWLRRLAPTFRAAAGAGHAARHRAQVYRRRPLA